MTAVHEKRSAVRRKEASNDDADSLKINGHEVKVSHLNKVLYPKVGFTKGQIIDYYQRIAPVMLPHLKDRPLTMKRYPNGVEAPFFYEKKCPTHRPDWVRTVSVFSKHNEGNIDFCVVNDAATLIWAVNLADLEFHTLLAKGDKVDSPTMIVFDLDPGAPAALLECARVGFWLHSALERLGLQSFAKTSGSKGLQVYVPLNSGATYDETGAFARKLAEGLAEQNPEMVVAKMSKSLRDGKVFVDWSQNSRHKTTVCVYSLRAKEQPTVSTPVTWDEVERAVVTNNADKLVFLPEQVLRRVEKLGDLFKPVLKLKQKVPKI
jgi:bifunctional non-homologous end joining protein LigD